MALKYPDRIESNNPQAYGIVKATEVSGAKNAAEYGGLLDIPDNILSASGDGSDALYLLWIDDNSVYRLVDWNNRHDTKGWQIEYACIPWNSIAHLNSFTESGNYYITGLSNGLAGGLPIINGDQGHTIEATLRVLDSSLTKDENLKQLCITLILSLSNRMGGDGHIYVRTIQTLEKDNLTRSDIESPSCTKWGTWEKLQGIFEKNVATNITDINTYTTNGMYSVVSGSTSLVSGFLFKTGDTLLIITVNGYHVATSGFNPQLTQLVYVLPAGNNTSSGAIEYQLSKLITRTALWNKTTKLWDYHNFQDLTDLGRIKEIKVNDTPLTIDSDKAINLDLDASYLEDGIAIALKDKNNSSVLKDVKVQIPSASGSTDGLMSSSDKEYLDLLNNKDHFQAITWSISFNANNYHNGNYRITGIRTSLSDNLPMQNAADGHSIDCYLKVLDSSLKPTDGSSVSEACVTQILTTSNRVGGDGHIYVRTGEALSGGYSNLSWSTWECLQGVFEKNLTFTTNLNTYTTNGMYSGVFIDSGTVSSLEINKFSTFLLITVNGTIASSVAQLSGETNSKAQLALLLYLTPIHQGAANIYLRTATWNGSSWQFGNFLRLTTSAEYRDILNNGLFQLRVSATEDNNRLVFINLNDEETGGIDLPKASNTTAGIMTAADKVKLDNAQATATAAQEKNAAQDARLDNIEARIEPDIAGRVWNEDNGTPKAESYYGSVKALRDLPKRLGLGRYIVKDDRTRRKLDPNDSHKYLDDGSTANLDGRDGQCMWCWNGFYANIWHEGSRLIKAVTFDGPVGNDISIWIPAGGISWLGAGVIDRGEAPYTDKTKWKLCSVINNSEQFRGGGGTALDASKFSKAPADNTPQITMLGMPATLISTTDFGTYARKRGEGWEANWFVARFVVEFLFEVIMGTENSQEAFNANKDADGLYQGGFGTGVTALNDWKNYNEEYPIIPTSVGFEAGDGVCLVPYSLPNTGGAEGAYHTFNVPVFFGLVGAGYGHLWQWVRGILLDKGEEKSLAYVVPSMYAESEYSHTTVEGKICTAEYPRNSGFIKRKSYRGLCCMPTETSGSSTTRYCCYLYTNVQYSKSICERAAGGVANIHTNGASSTIDYQGSTIVKPNYTSPLCYFTEDPKIPLSQSIANNS